MKGNISVPVSRRNSTSKDDPCVTVMSRINPINVSAEKSRFFEDPNGLYNPQFAYQGPIVQSVLARWAHPNFTYFEISKKIMRHAIATYGSFKHLECLSTGEPWPQNEALAIIHEFMRAHDLSADDIKITFRDNSIANASMVQSFEKGRHVARLFLRSDTGRCHLDGLLRHEIGTHYLVTFIALFFCCLTHFS